MPFKDLPPSVRDFVSGHIRSVEQLDILLLLQENPRDRWTVESVYAVILSAPASVERWLDELAAQGLLSREATVPPNYRYSAPPALAEQVSAVAQYYRTAPVRVIEAVYKPRTGAAQTFADAFKLKSPDRP